MVIVDKERIIAALHVDRLFKNFEIEMDQQEAVQFIEVAPLAGAPSTAQLSGLINSINKLIPPADFGPSYQTTGTTHQRYRIGRDIDRRVIKLVIFKMYFPVDYDYWGLFKDIQLLCHQAGGVMDIEPEPGSFSGVMRWGESQ